MDDTYVYISVKLNLKHGQTEDSIQGIIQEMDYSFEHDDIVEHEIIDILDTQIPEEEERDSFDRDWVDPFDISGMSLWED